MTGGQSAPAAATEGALATKPFPAHPAIAGAPLAIAGWGAAVAVLAAINLFAGLGAPPGPIWDENYYLTSYARYAEGRASLASHPPLGLMLITAGDRLSGLNRGVDLSPLARVRTLAGQTLPARFDLLGPRLAPALFGLLAMVGLYCVALAQGAGAAEAALWAGLAVVDTALLTQFRAAQLDAFEVCFTVYAVLALLLAHRSLGAARLANLAGAGLLIGAAAMIKLDGALLAAPAAVIIGAPLLHRAGRSARAAGRTGLELAVLGAGVVAVVVAVFGLQLVYSSRPPDALTPAGAVDAHALSPAYRDYLAGLRPLSPAVAASAAKDHLAFIVQDNAGVARHDPNGAPVLLQPLLQKPINYRWDSRDGRTAYVQLIANPVTWLTALAAVGLAVWMLLRPGPESPGLVDDAPIKALCAGWLVVTALHVAMETHRVMYLYHAFLPLVLGLCLAPGVWRRAIRRWPWLDRRRAPVLGAVGAAALAAFVFYAPLALHQPLTFTACRLRDAFGHVVDCQP